ncbi:MAG: GNAT family N-acetyltransferase [Sphingomonadaceae bacterium]|nr:GNAT family N-acetyltransferase [Sphingomonadaceae bacterium]
MTDSIPISTASLEDAASIAEIYAHYVAHSTATFETVAPGSAEMAARMELVFEGGYPWLVARDEQAMVLGYAYASRFKPRDGFRFACETSIYVRPDAMRRGLGTALLGALIEKCEATGLRQAFAIIAGTEPASVVLHARHGYRPCGTLENAGRKHGKWIDVFYMQRALGEGGDTPPPVEP